MHNRQDDGKEPEFSTNAPADLNCTRTGQVSTSLRGETVRSMNRALAEKMFASRKALKANPAELRQLVSERLQLPSLRGAPQATGAGSLTRSGYRIEKVAVETEPGVIVPSLIFVPDGVKDKAPATILLDPKGKQSAAKDHEVEAIVHGGQIVVLPDLRGWGESAASGKSSGYTGEWQTSMRALLVGKNMPGMQTYEALRVFDFLAARPGVDASRISIRGTASGALVALFTAAMDSRLHLSPSPVRSYMEAVKEDIPTGLPGVIVPGILADFDAGDLNHLVTTTAK